MSLAGSSNCRRSNADLQVVDANDKALSLYGYSLEDFRRLKARNLGPTSEQASLAAAIQLATDVGSARYKTVHMDAKGHRFPVESRLRAMIVAGRPMYQNIT
ncbi:MAG: PAS domain-containing protein, partial [Rhodocyclaceae bacterium]|nr:PAS domain-containing protein [Rhodocyclaceae bacterium]